MTASLDRFVAESNRIEGITRDPTPAELSITEWFLDRREVTIPDLCTFVNAVEPGAILRDQTGLDVRVGSHRPPLGGPSIPGQLTAVLEGAAIGTHPYRIHHEYETLHPFTDGNGRSGRALWLWGMRGYSQTRYDQALEIGFLRCWYYQSLECARFVS